jgi:hypothetical protein
LIFFVSFLYQDKKERILPSRGSCDCGAHCPELNVNRKEGKAQCPELNVDSNLKKALSA